MTPKGDLTKARLAESMLELIQTSGYSGTGLNAVIEHAAAPKGSVYFHFPDGKEGLGVAAVELAAKQFETMIIQIAQSAGGAAEAAKLAIQALAAIISDSGFRLGCPVSVVTLEMGDSSERLRQACATAFESWITPTTALLEADGVGNAQAKSLATVIVSTIEGAAIVSRAMKSTRPLLAAADAVADLIGLRQQGEGDQN
ncbi:TetR family transcriptional regulator [Arthrobacter sp. MYb214]|uniref:TetR/AcrR family transcriptional regulator n=1 Tax=Arthrobacter sp. MYb214 TaxID=1848596 RepID=UPI000CFB342E|nr:TetR/AcrR family transcriptional regulator [Arthrobacter sp. MYb214]PRB73210.1 TetR family transcriptional regulator [Arthrobacter sp. MYb214]